MRAILFASASRTSIGGLRISIPPSHVPGRAMNTPLDDDAIGSDDQQPPDGALSHLRRRPEPLFAARRMLPWHQTQPSGKVSCHVKIFGRRCEGRVGRGNQRANTQLPGRACLHAREGAPSSDGVPARFPWLDG